MATAPNIVFPGTTAFVDDIDALRALDSEFLTNKTAMLVGGNGDFADGGGGLYFWNGASMAVDDGLNVIRPTDRTPMQAGRWIGTTLTIYSDLVQQIEDNFAALADPPGSNLIGFSHAQAYVAGTQGAKGKQIVCIADAPFNCVCDGIANDSAGFTSAIAYQQATGCILQGPKGGTVRLSSWAKITTTAPFYLDGNGATFLCDTAPTVSFIAAQDDVEIFGCTFSGFFRIVDNPITITSPITNFKICDNVFLDATENASKNAYYIMLLSPFENLWIQRNTFRDGKVAAIYVGDNDHAKQDTWKNINISDNTIDGVSCPVTVGEGFGILVYGRDVVIDGNNISNIEGYTGSYSGSNAAFGIYTKARFNRVVNNSVVNVGLTTNGDSDQMVAINVKGAGRGETFAPEGYGSVVSSNTIKTVGVDHVSGSGISSDHSGSIITSNWIEDAGRKGISFGDGANATSDDLNIISNNAIRGNNVAFDGIESVTYNSQTIISDNNIRGNYGVRVRSSGSAGSKNVTVSGNMTNGAIGITLAAGLVDITKVLITGNVMKSGNYGLFFQTAGGVISDVMATDNDWSAAAVAAIGGSAPIPASTRLRNNKGYRSENGGVTSAIATGATVAHGCAVTPTVIQLTALDSGPTDAYVSAIGSSNFTVNYGGGGAHAFAWEAKIPAHYA